jgi:hypothetical protein
MGLIPNCGYAAVRLECFFVDGCGDPSFWSSSAYNSARQASGSQRQSVRRSRAVATRVRSNTWSHRPESRATDLWYSQSAASYFAIRTTSTMQFRQCL